MKCIKTVFLLSIFMVFISLNNANANNSSIKSFSSDQDFSTVEQKVLSFIKDKGLTVFAKFDHAKNAKDVNLELAPNTVIVFGSPVVGTKLMQNFDGIGIDLPLKVLISQNKKGQTIVSIQDLEKVFAPYGVKSDNQILVKMNGLLNALAKTATK